MASVQEARPGVFDHPLGHQRIWLYRRLPFFSANTTPLRSSDYRVWRARYPVIVDADAFRAGFDSVVFLLGRGLRSSP